MAHTREEVPLGCIGLVGSFACCLKGLLLPHLLALTLRYVLCGIDDGACLAVRVCLRQYGRAADPTVFFRLCHGLFRELAVRKGYIRVLPAKLLLKILSAENLKIFFTVVWMDEGLGIDSKTGLIVDFIVQSLFDFRKLLCYAAEKILLQIRIIGREEHAA